MINNFMQHKPQLKKSTIKNIKVLIAKSQCSFITRIFQSLSEFSSWSYALSRNPIKYKSLSAN